MNKKVENTLKKMYEKQYLMQMLLDKGVTFEEVYKSMGISEPELFRYLVEEPNKSKYYDEKDSLFMGLFDKFFTEKRMWTILELGKN